MSVVTDISGLRKPRFDVPKSRVRNMRALSGRV